MFTNDPVMGKRMNTLLTILAVVLIVFLGVKTLAVLKSDHYNKDVMSNTISVAGVGEVVAVPDIASVSFAVVEQAKTVAGAQSNSTVKINITIDALLALGIEERDIQTTNYNAYPRYEYFNQTCTQFSCPPEGRQTIVGYEVRQSITVKIRDIEKAGDVLSAVGASGASDISGLSFMIDNEEEKLREARKIAIDDAREQAEILARDLDVKIVGIVGFNESGNFPVPMYAFKDMAVGMGGSAESSVPRLPTGENKIVSSVMITYEIR